MDTDEVISQLDQLESRIGYLIEKCRTLENAKIQLESRVEELETALEEKIEAEERTQKQKALIQSKIDDLLTRLDDISEPRPLFRPENQQDQ